MISQKHKRLFYNNCENDLKHFKIILYRCTEFDNIVWYHRKLYVQILENFLKFYDGRPRSYRIGPNTTTLESHENYAWRN